MRVLVTGAGLVGSWVARHLLEMGHSVAVFDVVQPAAWAYDVIGPPDAVTFHQGDITDLPDVLRAIQDTGSDAIVHTAALLTAAVRRRAYAGIRINVMGAVNVLEAARLAGGLRVVFCSSSTAYASIGEITSRSRSPRTSRCGCWPTVRGRSTRLQSSRWNGLV